MDFPLFTVTECEAFCRKLPVAAAVFLKVSTRSHTSKFTLRAKSRSRLLFRLMDLRILALRRGNEAEVYISLYKPSRQALLDLILIQVSPKYSSSKSILQSSVISKSLSTIHSYQKLRPTNPKMQFSALLALIASLSVIGHARPLSDTPAAIMQRHPTNIVALAKDIEHIELPRDKRTPPIMQRNPTNIAALAKDIDHIKLPQNKRTPQPQDSDDVYTDTESGDGSADSSAGGDDGASGDSSAGSSASASGSADASSGGDDASDTSATGSTASSGDGSDASSDGASGDSATGSSASAGGSGSAA